MTPRTPPVQNAKPSQRHDHRPATRRTGQEKANMPKQFGQARDRYARSLQRWLVLVAHAANRRPLTYGALGRILADHPKIIGWRLDPIDAHCQLNGLPPLAIIVVDKASGEPGRGNVGIFRHDWFDMFWPTPEEPREAHVEAEEARGGIRKPPQAPCGGIPGTTHRANQLRR